MNEITKKEVPYDKIVKGYKDDDDYVIIEGAGFEAAAPEKTKVIEIESFVDVASVNPMYYENSYYTEPPAKNNKAYALLLAALKKSGKAGLANKHHSKKPDLKTTLILKRRLNFKAK